MHQLFHHIHTEEIKYKNVFLQPDNVPSKLELLMSYTAAVVTRLWFFIQIFSKYSFPELKNFLHHFPANLCLKCSMFEIKTLLNNVSESRHYITDRQKCIYQQKTPRFIVHTCYRQQLKLHSSLKTGLKYLTWLCN